MQLVKQETRMRNKQEGKIWNKRRRKWKEDKQKMVAVLFDRESMEISTDVMPLLKLNQLVAICHFSSSSASSFVLDLGYREDDEGKEGGRFFSRV